MICKRLSKMSIGKRLILVITICSCSAFLVMCVLLFSLGRQSATRGILDTGKQQINEGRRIADNACSYLRGIADYYSSEPRVRSFFTTSKNGTGTQQSQYLFSLFQKRQYVLGIILYRLDGTPSQYMTIDGSEEPLSQASRETFQALIHGTTPYAWEFVPQRGNVLFKQDNSPKICLWHVVKGANNASLIGVMAVTMDTRRLLRFGMPYNTTFYQSYFIVDSQSENVVSNYTGYTLSPESIHKLIAQVTAGEAADGFPVEFGGNVYSAFAQRILDTPLYVYCFLSKDRVTLYARGMWATIVMAVIVYLCATMPMLAYVYRRLTKPLKMVTDSMNRFAEGNFDTKLSFYMDDDIGRLGWAFNQMVQDNRALIEKNYVVQIKAKEAELSLLQAQINPHFIYNLINSIQWSALRRGDKEIAEIAYSMGQMLRICLNRGSGMIRVEQECEMVAYYLKLQKVRYRERITYSVHVDQSARSALIPKLIIQPLVENSVVHGAENHAATTSIAVRVEKDGNRIVLLVDDDGVGIPKEILAQLPADYRPRGEYSSGYALKNIDERLSLIYKRDYVFSIDSAVGQGTHIRIELPEKPDEAHSGRGDNPCSGF